MIKIKPVQNTIIERITKESMEAKIVQESTGGMIKTVKSRKKLPYTEYKGLPLWRKYKIRSSPLVRTHNGARGKPTEISSNVVPFRLLRKASFTSCCDIFQPLRSQICIIR
uniref:Uncharacterized protein n=2 Tax=Micrurus spixii TaxID=129469 RepID=A0A2D4MCX8_9SAUR